MSLDKTIAVILAAGRGKRLGNLTLDNPKCLVLVQGLSILYYQLSAIRKAGISDVVMVTGFLDKKIEKYALENFPELRFKFVHNALDTSNTLYSLALAAEVIGGDMEVLQLNGDVIFDQSIIEALFSADRLRSYVSLEKKICGEEEIKIVLASSGAAAFLNKNVAPEEAIGEAIGINKFSPKFWAALSNNLKLLKDKYFNEYFEYAIEWTIAEGHQIYPLDIGDRYAIEIDFPEDLERVEKLFHSPIHGYAKTFQSA